MAETSSVKLSWVIVDGQPHHVSEYSHLPPGERPFSRCPVCERQVILRLGPDVAHHAGHKPGDACAVTSEETALHVNMKFHLARELKNGARLRILRPCASPSTIPGRPGCSMTLDVVWAESWDRVEVECRLGSRRPDVALFAGSEPVGAIEVFVTHRVDDEKATVLREEQIRWIEVQATADLSCGPNQWTLESPLPVLREEPNIPWRCARHQEMVDRHEFNQLNYVKAAYQRIVDLLYPSGKVYRDVFTIWVDVRAGKVHEAWISRAGNDYRYGIHKPLNRLMMFKEADSAFSAFVKKRSRNGTIVDSPMTWIQCKPSIASDVSLLTVPGYCRQRWEWRSDKRVWFLPQPERTRTWTKGAEALLLAFHPPKTPLKPRSQSCQRDEKQATRTVIS